MARFFLPKKNIEGHYGKLTGQELEHLRKALRLRPGDPVVLFDDEGWEHEGILRSYSPTAAMIDIVNSYRPERESRLRIFLAHGLSKGEKMDFVVEKATELGVHGIVPFFSSRTVPKLESAKFEKRRERWEKIALSAAKQSGRTQIPKILPFHDFPELVKKDWRCPLKLLFWEKETDQGLAQIRAANKEAGFVLVVVGPEGGFSDDEAEEAMRNGFQPVRLGHRTLRTETAALAALALVQYLWGDLA